MVARKLIFLFLFSAAVTHAAPKWHRVKVSIPKTMEPKHTLVYIEDLDHPIGSPDWQAWDARNVDVKAGRFLFWRTMQITFLAPVGDHLKVRWADERVAKKVAPGTGNELRP